MNIINVIAIILIIALFLGKGYAGETCEKKCLPNNKGMTAQVMVCTDDKTGAERRIWIWKKIDGRPPVPAACTD